MDPADVGDDEPSADESPDADTPDESATSGPPDDAGSADPPSDDPSAADRSIDDSSADDAPDTVSAVDPASDTVSGSATERDGPSTAGDPGESPGVDSVTGGTGTSVGSLNDERAGTGVPQHESEGPGEWVSFAYDVVSSVLAVLIVGLLLFAVSGVWPPMVAVESPSMTPHMQTGDLVFVMEEERFPGEGAHEGVVTARTAGDVGYQEFGRSGDVIVYNPDGNTGTTPIIHRAMLWVDEDENWYDRADRQSVGRYSECGDTPDEAMPNCPAPHAGFITKGDANGIYDQVQGRNGLSGPVKPAWVVGTAEVRIPLLGCIRLRTEGCLALATPAGVSASPAGDSASSAGVTASPGNATFPSNSTSVPQTWLHPGSPVGSGVVAPSRSGVAAVGVYPSHAG